MNAPEKDIYFFVPGLSEKYRTGGLLVIRDVAELISQIPGFKSTFVTTHEKHPEALSPGTFNHPPSTLFVVTWGPLVEQHIKLIRKNAPKARIIYYAQSFGWDIKVPTGIPIICVSRYVMSQWAIHAPENFCAYIPPPLNPCFKLENQPRDIDIFVHTRKQNEYCLKKLLPAIKDGGVKIEEKWIPQEKFAELLNRTKLFLYLTSPHKAGWRRVLPGEGFGLPALEALACGALVGSNLLGGVTDFLTPGENCIKLQNGDLDFDLKQIHDALSHFTVNEKTAEAVTKEYSRETVRSKWALTIEKLFG